MSSPKLAPAQVEDVVASGSVFEGEKTGARNATDFEHSLNLRDSFKLYPKAIGFSLLFSTAIIMEGYDLSLLGSFYGYDA
jgi:SP family general alpha glucoside:H+ symporter-like MFS transporter